MPEWWIFLTDFIGVGAAAVSGAMIAIERKLDLFGIFFLATVTALGGGITRDILIGQLPPRFFTSYFAILIVVIAASTVFLIARFWNGWRDPVTKHRIDKIHNLFDAIGLAAFTVTGVQVTLSVGYGNNAILCVLMGMTTGVGGGMLRDMMSQHTPYIFQKRIYATASILGALVYWVMFRLGASHMITQLTAMTLIIGIRVCATVFRWNLPRIDLHDPNQKTNEIEAEKECSDK